MILTKLSTILALGFVASTATASPVVTVTSLTARGDTALPTPSTPAPSNPTPSTTAPSTTAPSTTAPSASPSSTPAPSTPAPSTPAASSPTPSTPPPSTPSPSALSAPEPSVDSKSKASSAAETSVDSSSTNGKIQVKVAGKDEVLGFIKKDLNKNGEYSVDNDNALTVLFPVGLAQNGPVNIYAVDGGSVPTRPFVGAISGFWNKGDDLTKDNTNYAYLGGTTPTSLGSPAVPGDGNTLTDKTKLQKNIQSHIFKYDPKSKEITAEWVNSDKSKIPVEFGFLEDSLLITGSIDKFKTNFPAAKAVKLFFVPA